MSGRLVAFLAARELDEAAALAVEWSDLSPQEQARVRDVLSRTDDRLARRNVLLHPGAIPADAVLSALLTGLRSEYDTIALAAVVGSHQVGGRLTGAARQAVAGPVWQLLSAARPAIVRQRASAAMVVLASEQDTEAMIGYLSDPDPVVRHNMRAGLVRTLGPRQAVAALTEANQTGDVAAETVRFVSDAVDGGAATNHQLVVRGVLGPQLVPLTSLEGPPD